MPKITKHVVLAVLILHCFVGTNLFSKYKIKDLQVKPAQEYQAHIDFQNLVIGAAPYETKEKAKELFDTDKVWEKGFLPILIVIENNNTFPVRIRAGEIFLLDKSGRRHQQVSFEDVLVAVSLKKPPSNFSGKKELAVQRLVDKDMYADFQHKSFGEKLIAPLSSDFGIVFFRELQQNSVEGLSLYLPEIVNASTEDALVFFEFELQPIE